MKKTMVLILAITLNIIVINKPTFAQKGNVVLDEVSTNVGVSTDSLFFQFRAITGFGNDSCVTVEMMSKINPTAARNGNGDVLPYKDGTNTIVNNLRLCFEQGYLDSLIYPVYETFIDSLQTYSGWDTIIPYNK